MTAAQAAILLEKHQCGVCRRDPLIVPCEDCKAESLAATGLLPSAADCIVCPCLTCDRNRRVERDDAALRRARRASLMKELP